MDLRQIAIMSTCWLAIHLRLSNRDWWCLWDVIVHESKGKALTKSSGCFVSKTLLVTLGFRWIMRRRTTSDSKETSRGSKVPPTRRARKHKRDEAALPRSYGRACAPVGSKVTTATSQKATNGFWISVTRAPPKEYRTSSRHHTKSMRGCAVSIAYYLYHRLDAYALSL